MFDLSSIFGNPTHFKKRRFPQADTINLSNQVTYRTQRENRIKPHSTCNTTSMAMALDISGWSRSVDCPPNKALPDFLTEFFTAPLAARRQKELAPWSIGTFPPEQVHAVLEWGVNYMVGRKVVRFSTTWCIEDIKQNIRNKRPVVLSGDFPFLDRRGNWTTLGHIVVLVGLIERKDEFGNIIKTEFIIDDPYGDYHTGYRDQNGNDVIMSEEDFVRIIRGDAVKKWGHIFTSEHPLGPFLGKYDA